VLLLIYKDYQVLLINMALILKSTDKVKMITMTGDIDLASLMSKETWKGLKYLHKEDNGKDCKDHDHDEDHEPY